MRRASFHLKLSSSFSFLLACFISLAVVQHATAVGPRDFNGDGNEELLLWVPVFATAFVVNSDGSIPGVGCGQTGDIPLSGEINGDGISEVIVWRPAGGTSPGKFIVCIWGQDPIEIPIGSPGDVPITTADFNGDGKNDPTLYRPSTGQWFKVIIDFGVENPIPAFGLPGDIPVPDDYDGDGKDDIAVFRPTTGEWYTLFSSTGSVGLVAHGLPEDIPVHGDYDGDGQAEHAVWRPSTGQWFIRFSSGFVRITQFGLPYDSPIRADINNDGVDDFALYRPSTGEIFYKTAFRNEIQRISTPYTGAWVMNAVRRRIPHNDFDGDGRSDYVVVREGKNELDWYIANANGTPFATARWGGTGAVELPRDYTGDGRTDLAVVTNSSGVTRWSILSSEGRGEIAFNHGAPGDQLVPADYDGDGKADATHVADQSNGTLRWNIRSTLNNNGNVAIAWGLIGDHALAADFDGDRRSNLTVVRNDGGLLWWFSRTFEGVTYPAIQWGLAGDEPVPGDYDGDGRDDYAVLRDVGGQLYLFVRTAAGQQLGPIPWGLSGDTFVPGYFEGSLKLQPNIWRPQANPFFAVNFFPVNFTLFSWGVPTDRAVQANATVGAPEASSSPIGCDGTLSNSDGGGGYVHKPVSEGDGKLVVLLRSSFAGKVTEMRLAENGRLIETGRFVGNTNGNRPTFRFSRAGRDYANNLVQVFTRNDTGETLCITIPNPGQRYD